MNHYVDEKPLAYLTREECTSLHLHAKKEETPIGSFSRTEWTRKKAADLFDRTGKIEHLPIFENAKEVPFGYVPKNTAKLYGIRIPKHIKPTAMMKDTYKNEWVGLFDKSDHPALASGKNELLQFERQIKSGELEVYRRGTRPETWLGKFNRSLYYLNPSKQPTGIYLSNAGRYSYLYDMSDEMAKNKYQDGNIPIGFFTKSELIDLDYDFHAEEEPVAYIAYGHSTVAPLYDRSHHPKFRLRRLTGQVRN